MKIRCTLAAATVMLGVAAPAASAHPRPHGYAHTYPVASALCTRVAAGHTPKGLAADTAQITAACTALSNSYNQALSTYQAAVAPIAAQVRSTLASVRAARQTAKQTHNWSAYEATVTQAINTLKTLRAEVRTAQQAYTASIRAARQTFWSTIHALRGASALPTDRGATVLPPAPVIPTSV
jgi:hypothetical protein